MKLTRFVLFLLIVFTFSITPVRAKEGESYGFVRLLTQIDPNIPLRVQTQQAFDELLPQLLTAKKNGAILEFEPDLQVGIVKIKYAAGARELAFGKTQVFNDIKTAAALVLQQQILEAQPEISAPRFSFELYTSCFHASGVPSNAKVIGSMRDKTGRIVSNYAGTTSAINTFMDCFTDWAGSYSDVLPGYKLEFKIYTDFTGTTLFGSYTITVPSMSFAGINQANSTAQGTAPAGKQYFVSWWHPNLDEDRTLSFPYQDGTVSADRTWRVDFDDAPFRGGDQLLLIVDQNINFRFVHRLTIPHVYCQLGSNICYLQGFPLQSRSMTITHAGIPYTFTGKADGTGFFGVQLIDKKGYPIFLVKGDKISGTGIQPYSLPNLTASPNFDTNVVSGNVPADKYFELSVRDDYDQTWYVEWVLSKPTVNFYAVNYYTAQHFDLKSSDALTFRIEYTDPVSGNKTKMLSSVGP